MVNRVITHGMTGTKEYRTFNEIKRRCFNKNSKDYKRYGARGITLDPLFVNDFPAFLKEVGMSPTPEHSIDRIDTSKGYLKGNMKWSTREEQANNKRLTSIVTIDGVTYNGFSEAARAMGVTKTTIQRRCKGFYDKRFNHWSPPKKGYSYEPRYNGGSKNR